MTGWAQRILDAHPFLRASLDARVLIMCKEFTMRNALLLSCIGTLALFFSACGEELDSDAQQSMPVGYGQSCASSTDCISELCHPVSLRCTIACTNSAECGSGAACEGGLCVFGATPGGESWWCR